RVLLVLDEPFELGMIRGEFGLRQPAPQVFARLFFVSGVGINRLKSVKRLLEKVHGCLAKGANGTVCLMVYRAAKKGATAAKTSAAVSMRKMRRPRSVGCQACAAASAISSSVKPPSGPTAARSIA